MVPLRAQGNLDRCYWYKADRYYPEDRVVVVPGRVPREGQPLQAPDAPWRELAPLARAWYEVRHEGLCLDVRTRRQRFVPDEATLYSEVDYGPVTAWITTFMHARRSLLVIHYSFSKPVRFRACAAAGVWVAEGYEPDPLDEVEYRGGVVLYRLEGTRGRIALALDQEPQAWGGDDCLWQEAPVVDVTQYVMVADDKDGPLDEQALDSARALGYEALRAQHLAVWREYFAYTRLTIPHPLFQRVYDFSLYQFKAAQHPISGACRSITCG